MKQLFLPALIITLLIASCIASTGPAAQSPILLVSFTENDVHVSIRLGRDQERNPILSATFTPPESYHLYSKDIPVNGLDGLGRPTLLELASDSQLVLTSGLMESVQAQVPNFEPRELLVYRAGSVTLSLQVELPPGDKWLEDAVIVTYMACSDKLCKLPVVGKLVSIRIPGADAFDTP